MNTELYLRLPAPMNDHSQVYDSGTEFIALSLKDNTVSSCIILDSFEESISPECIPRDSDILNPPHQHVHEASSNQHQQDTDSNLTKSTGMTSDHVNFLLDSLTHNCQNTFRDNYWQSL